MPRRNSLAVNGVFRVTLRMEREPMASCAFYCVKKERRRNRKEEEAERSVRCGFDVSWMHELSSLVEQEPLVLIGISYKQLWVN